jgi:hypothetical protein
MSSSSNRNSHSNGPQSNTHIWSTETTGSLAAAAASTITKKFESWGNQVPAEPGKLRPVVIDGSNVAMQ